MPLSSPRFSRDRDLQLASQNRPPLEEGARGDGVKILQRALIDLDFDMPKSTTTGSPDGVYGLETKATVQAFQRDNGLTADGVAGQDTLNRLDQIFSALEEQQRLQEVADANTRGPLGKWLIT